MLFFERETSLLFHIGPRSMQVITLCHRFLASTPQFSSILKGIGQISLS